jgi:hypothetical protein
MLFSLSGYEIEVDTAATAAFYQTAPTLTASCQCQDCRNYEQAVGQLSTVALEFFDDLGVDPAKPAEVYTLGDTVPVWYGGFYHLCGQLLEVPKVPQADAWHRLSDALSVSFRGECDLLEDGFPTPAFQMEISLTLPWVLNEERMR